MKPIIFLDIDGVLNDHAWCNLGEGWGPKIDAEPARCLQNLIARSGAALVITSTWRSYVNRGWMTVEGFGALLRSHGIVADVVGVLPAGSIDQRATQILAWVGAHSPPAWVVLDDLNLTPGLGVEALKLIRTDPGHGLKPYQVPQALAVLGVARKPSQPTPTATPAPTSAPATTAGAVS